MQFDHIGIVTPTLAGGRTALSATVEILRWTEEFTDPVNGVFVQFGLDCSGICYELIAPRGDDSPIMKAASTGRHILNHLAYLVPDLAQARERLQASGAVSISEPHPSIAYGGSYIQFFITPMRLMIELIEAPAHQHQYNQWYEPSPEGTTA